MTTHTGPLVPFDAIQGVTIAEIRRFADERGAFSETFRREWFPHVSWDKLQTNRSDSKAGVLRGLHYHLHQVDYWLVLAGTMRVGLADLRPQSPTYMQSASIDLSADASRGLFIPVGVAHGFLALTDVTLTYIVNNYYDGGADERGVAWDDPLLAVPWHPTVAPLLSPRDQQNRRLAEIPVDELPKG